MGGLVSVDDRATDDKRSHVEAARGPGHQQQARRRSECTTINDDDAGRSSVSQAVAPESDRALRAIVRQLQALLAEEKRSNVRAEDQLKASARQALARTARMEEQLDATKVQLVHEQHQRANDGACLRRVNVLLKSKQQELKDLQASHDRLQAIVEDRNAARLLAGGVNIQAACPTLLEIEARIRHTLTVKASEWIEEAPSGLAAVVPLAQVLSQAFLGCEDLVNSIVRGHELFMRGGMDMKNGANPVDEVTVDVFRQHVRRHHLTLFPLTGERLENARCEVISKVARWLQDFFFRMSGDEIVRDLINTKLDQVVAEYLPIMVGATLLEPAVAFSNDCGTEQPFDPTIHAESIDGDAVKVGQPCIVVFPALLIEREGHSSWGVERLHKSFVLPVPKC